jgi:zinc transport system ATP-binding protein
MLEIKNLSYSYDKQETILDGVNMALSAGKSLGIIGPNGGGKSTLLKLILGLLRPTSGSISVMGVETQKLSSRQRGEVFSYLPQDIKLSYTFPITVSDLMQWGDLINPPNHQRVLQAIKMVNMENHLNSKINTLSGGQRQRALIAKAIIGKPKIMVLDEPTSGLDSQSQDDLKEIINKMKCEFSTTIIMVDHDIQHTIGQCDQVLCLNKTLHWHEHKELLTQQIIDDIYHCEFEHLVHHQHGKCHD